MSFKRVRDVEKSPVKTVEVIPPTGTVRGFSRADINEMDRTDRASLLNDDMFIVRDGTDDFLTLAKSLTELTNFTPIVDLPSYIVREKQHKNVIIRAISDYIAPPRRFYFTKDENLNLSENFRRAEFHKLIEDTCFRNLNINMYLYVNPIVVKYLVEFDRNHSYNFIRYRPQTKIDRELLEQDLKIKPIPAIDETIQSVSRELEILKANYERVKNNLNIPLRKLIQKKENLPASIRRDDPLFIRYQEQILKIEFDLLKEEDEYRKNKNALEEKLERVRLSHSFDYNEPHSIIFTVGQVPSCDKYDQEFNSVNYLHIYTDGSLDNISASSAVYIPLVNRVVAGKIQRKEIYHDTFRCELYAILLALKWFDNNITNNSKVPNIFYTKYEYSRGYRRAYNDVLIPRIYTDNYFCIFILNKCIRSSIKTLLEKGESVLFCEPNDLRSIEISTTGADVLRNNYTKYLMDNVDLISEIVKYNFNLVHVKSHTGVFGNSVADMFAGYARLNKDFLPEVFYEFDIEATI